MKTKVGKAIEIFIEKVLIAENNHMIRKPISWALYETWMYFDKYEKERRITYGYKNQKQ